MQAVENIIETGGCDHKLRMPISINWLTKGMANMAMARLKAMCMLIVDWKKNPRERFCCHFVNNQKAYFDLVDQVLPQYRHATLEEAKEAYKKTLEKLKSTVSHSGVQLKAERGVYNNDQLQALPFMPGR